MKRGTITGNQRFPWYVNYIFVAATAPISGQFRIHSATTTTDWSASGTVWPQLDATAQQAGTYSHIISASRTKPRAHTRCLRVYGQTATQDPTHYARDSETNPRLTNPTDHCTNTMADHLKITIFETSESEPISMQFTEFWKIGWTMASILI